MALGDYRIKPEEELRWNAVKRAALSRATYMAACYKERILNDSMAELAPAFRAALDNGKLPELEEEYKTWVKDALGGTEVVAP